MYSDSKKIQLIEEVLRLENPNVLKEIESVLKKSKITTAKNGTAYDLLGQWSKEDSELIEQAITEGCEQINMDEWRQIHTGYKYYNCLN
jgi:hypothetical protein